MGTGAWGHSTKHAQHPSPDPNSHAAAGIKTWLVCSDLLGGVLIWPSASNSQANEKLQTICLSLNLPINIAE
jgi:hypothetical protein